MHRSYRYKLKPTQNQDKILSSILHEQRILYNSALTERIDCYRKTGKSLSVFDQYKSVTEWRKSDEDARSIPANIQRWTLKRLDDCFNAFFKRLKTKEKSGFTRYRSYVRWKSFGFVEFSGIRLIDNKIKIKDIPGIKVHLHRPLPNTDIRSCTFTKDADGWYVSFQIEIEPNLLPKTGRHIGIDMGINSLAVLSNGEQISNIRTTERLAKELRIRQRAVSRCKKGSKSRKKKVKQVSLLHLKIRNTRNTYLHQVSARLVKDYDLIAIEKLNIKGLAAGMLSREVHDASWGKLVNFLRYKAAKAGGAIIEVDPRFTSQTCPKCGNVAKKELRQRVHSCPCGSVLDRDVAAAKVILHRAGIGPGFDKQRSAAA